MPLPATNKRAVGFLLMKGYFCCITCLFGAWQEKELSFHTRLVRSADPDSSVLGWGEPALLTPLDCGGGRMRGRGSGEGDEQRGIYDSEEISEQEEAS